ncbi:MAG TPA: hypothetical protein VJ949_04270 [Cryomorphaceae bacterium]|nr:hypothetical protein [Cryomorphaceae bacterium]
MKKLVLLALALTSLNQGFSQDMEVNWGESFEADKRYGFGDFLGTSNGKYFNLMWELKGNIAIMNPSFYPTLEVLDEDLNLLKKTPLIWEDDYGWLEGHALRGEELFFFGLTYDKKTDELALREVKYNLNGDKLVDRVLASFDLEKKKFKSFLEVKVSENKNHVSFFHQVQTTKNGDPLKFQLAAYDLENEELIYQKDFQIADFFGEDSFYNDHVIDNRGYTYMVLNTTTGVRDKLTKATLFVFDPEGNEVHRRDMVEGDNYLRGVEFLATANNDIYIAAMVMNGKTNKRSRYIGYATAQLNTETFVLDNRQSAEFSEELIYKMDAKPKKDGTIKHRGAFDLQFIPKEGENAGGYIVGEAIYSTARSERQGIIKNVTITTNFREIIAVDVSADGSIGNATIIPKNQIGSISYNTWNVTMGPLEYSFLPGGAPRYLMDIQKQYFSYFAYVHDGKLNILFNGDKKNYDIDTMDDAKPMTNPRKAFTMHYVFDGKELEQNVFLENKEFDAYFISERSHYEKGKAVLGAQKKKMRQYGFVKMD